MPALHVGRYIVSDLIGAGGMATVHVGRLRGAAGFSRTVAVKRLLPQYASNPEFESLFVQEARLVSRIQHANVVSTLDAVADNGELILVMEYVAGETFARLMQQSASDDTLVPHPIALRVVCDALQGLHAAHEATDRLGNPLNVVHRDISPHNLMVGADGITRVLDFGIAKAATSVDLTEKGVVRGKAAYMAPEQLLANPLTRRSDIYAMGVVLWEALVSDRLFPGGTRPDMFRKIEGDIPHPRERNPAISDALNALVMRALSRAPDGRFATARDMAVEIERHSTLATHQQVADWVKATATESLAERAAIVARVERHDGSLAPANSLAIVDSRLSLRPAPPRAVRAAVEAPATVNRRRSMGLAAGLIVGAALLVSALVSRPTLRSEPAEVETAGPATATPTAAPTAPAAPKPTPALPTRAVKPVGVLAVSDDNGPTAPTSPALGAPPPAVSKRKQTPRRVPTAATQSQAASASPKTQRPLKQPRTTQRPAQDCTPPYTIDARGRRHYKAHCF
jgi:serine/threonine-protein kinase